jgi:thioredoxin 1
MPLSNAATATTTVTDADFAERVLASDRPVLVEFWAPWCPPCRMIAPILEEIAADHAAHLTVAKVNTDENPQTVAACRVTANPTMQVYRDGELVHVIVGARSKARLLAELAEPLGIAGHSASTT